MNCPTCKQTNGLERNFCGGCGAALAQYCRCCGFRNAAMDRFCGGCGASLAEAALSRPTAAALPPAVSPVARATPLDAGISELLEAAQEGSAPPADEGNVRVSQDDIDSLFEE